METEYIDKDAFIQRYILEQRRLVQNLKKSKSSLETEMTQQSKVQDARGTSVVQK